jgi:transketolase
MDATELHELGQQFRVDSIRCAAAAKSGHPTSGMSAADLMAVLAGNHFRYDFDDPKNAANDRLVFSKGHASTLLYAIFRAAGAITDEEMLRYRTFDSMLEGHPTPLIPWVDVATGSLGQGLPIGVGMGLAGKYLDRLPSRVWVLCGDSEMAEGSMWEAFEHAAHYELDNLTAIIDVNRLGQRGETMVGWNVDTYRDRAEAFGWNAIEIDGHNVEAIDAAYSEAASTSGKPTVVIAKTVKGKGVKAVENQPGWHGKALDNPDEAIEELGGIRNIQVKVARPAPGRRTSFRAASSSSRATTSAKRLRRARRTVTRWLRSAMRAATSSLWTARWAIRRSPRSSRRSIRTVTSRCTSQSSSCSRRPSGCRRVAGTRSRPPSPRSFRARTTSSAWRRSAARTSGSPVRTPVCRSARTGPRRWH